MCGWLYELKRRLKKYKWIQSSKHCQMVSKISFVSSKKGKFCVRTSNIQTFRSSRTQCCFSAILTPLSMPTIWPDIVSVSIENYSYAKQYSDHCFHANLPIVTSSQTKRVCMPIWTFFLYKKKGTKTNEHSATKELFNFFLKKKTLKHFFENNFFRIFIWNTPFYSLTCRLRKLFSKPSDGGLMALISKSLPKNVFSQNILAHLKMWQVVSKVMMIAMSVARLTVIACLLELKIQTTNSFGVAKAICLLIQSWYIDTVAKNECRRPSAPALVSWPLIQLQVWVEWWQG